MKKNKVINTLLVGCAMFAITGGVVGVQNQTTVSANNTQTQLVEPETFASIQGAQVRKVGNAGIRFSTLVNDTWLDTDLAGKTVEYGYRCRKTRIREGSCQHRFPCRTSEWACRPWQDSSTDRF